MRLCPVCRTELNETVYHKQTVDRCPGCGGIFFDQGELEAIIRLVDLFQQISLPEPEIDTICQTEKNRSLACPADGTLMRKREVGGEVIDTCPVCRGIWLDRGEIVALKMAEDHIRENLNLYIRLGN